LATALDIKLAPLAGQLIGEFGKTLQYNKRGSSNYDAYTATTILSEVVSFTIKGLVENYMRPTDGGGFDPASLVSANDKKVIVAASSFPSPPFLDDEIVIDNNAFKVVNIKEQYISDTIAYYEFRARR
jgi:hypothetical protein